MQKEPIHKNDPFQQLEKLANSTHAPRGKYGAQAGYELLKKHIHPFEKRTFTLPVWRGIAAAILILLAGWWIVREYGQPELLLFETTAQTRIIELKDGSRVTLNRYSALTVPQNFKGTAREVTLRGEALFEVVKNAGKPFRVLTGEVTVEVLGTVFNVNAYRENPEIVTTLLEGRVAVKEAENGQELLLSPGERAVYSLSEKELAHDTGTDTEGAVA
ncbi:MAG: FecR domain-containing protein [Bacteroides sp.]|nr:FecR domain-containing protein [Bacteroides sp.]